MRSPSTVAPGQTLSVLPPPLVSRSNDGFRRTPSPVQTGRHPSRKDGVPNLFWTLARTGHFPAKRVSGFGCGDRRLQHGCGQRSGVGIGETCRPVAGGGVGRGQGGRGVQPLLSRSGWQLGVRPGAAQAHAKDDGLIFKSAVADVSQGAWHTTAGAAAGHGGGGWIPNSARCGDEGLDHCDTRACIESIRWTDSSASNKLRATPRHMPQPCLHRLPRRRSTPSPT